MRLFHKEIKQVDFCEQVCDRTCRADAAREQARQAVLSGWRLV